MLLDNAKYVMLKESISKLLNTGRQKASKAVNTVLVNTYWHIGRHIVEFEQDGESRATYGDSVVDKLSKDLTLELGKGFSRSNLFLTKKLYLYFPKVQTLSGLLSWSHYVELLKAENELERNFYINQCELENWSVRELKRQMKSMLFHRIALSKDKEGVLNLSRKGDTTETPSDLLKDPYVFEFLDLPDPLVYSESDLEQKLIDNLEKFLMELGKGFAFIGRQYRISIGGRHFFVDLVFYHRILKCFVLFDLKKGEVDHSDIGQMNLYLNYFEKEESVEDDNPPVGIVLGAYKDHILMEYAMDHITNQLFVSKYQFHLPDRKVLTQALERILEK